MGPKYSEEDMKKRICKKVYSRFAKDKLKKCTVTKLFKSIYHIEKEIAERNSSDLQYFYEILQKLNQELKISLHEKPVKVYTPDSLPTEVCTSVDHKIFLKENGTENPAPIDYWNYPSDSEELTTVFKNGLDKFFLEKEFKKTTAKAVFNWLRMPLRKKRDFDDTDNVYYSLFLNALKKLTEEGKYVFVIKQAPKPVSVYNRTEVSIPAQEQMSDDGSYEVKKKRDLSDDEDGEEEEEEEEKPKKKLKKKVNFQQDEEVLED